MADATAFFTTMAALSAAVQTFNEHLLKRFMLDKDEWEKKKRSQGVRHACIHALSFVVGAVLVYSLGLTPLAQLGLQQPLWVNSIAAGFLVSFGGGLFNDVLGILQEFKQAQEAVRNTAR